MRSQRFDVFLSFAEEDQDFAEEVRHRIVSKLKLRVFVPSEGESLILSHVLYNTLSPSLTPSYPPILSLSLCSLFLSLARSLSLSLSLYLYLPPSLSFCLFPSPSIHPSILSSYKCFPLSADLMPGKVFHREIADMITSGCRKTIIILSPDYVQSSWCNYEANLVINRSPGNSESKM